jgi:probable rRNA maturation factor
MRMAKSGIRRSVRIHHGHPGLRFDRRAVATVIHLLDAHAAEILGRSRLDLRPSTLDSRRSSSGLRPSTLDPRLSTPPGVPPGELSLAFLTGAALARLHGKFLGDSSATDVITFAGTPALGQAGEICISADAARAFARKHRCDFSEELTLYVVHGWLHLAGHDDRQPASKRRMRAAEARALALLRAEKRMPRFAFPV